MGNKDEWFRVFLSGCYFLYCLSRHALTKILPKILKIKSFRMRAGGILIAVVARGGMVSTLKSFADGWGLFVIIRLSHCLSSFCEGRIKATARNFGDYRATAWQQALTVKIADLRSLRLSVSCEGSPGDPYRSHMADCRALDRRADSDTAMEYVVAAQCGAAALGLAGC